METVNTNTTEKTFTLTVTDSGKWSSAGRYHYKVIDETGALVSDRKSNREYEAAEIYGNNYFGRVDLALKHLRKYPSCKIAYLKK